MFVLWPGTKRIERRSLLVEPSTAFNREVVVDRFHTNCIKKRTSDYLVADITWRRECPFVSVRLLCNRTRLAVLKSPLCVLCNLNLAGEQKKHVSHRLLRKEQGYSIFQLRRRCGMCVCVREKKLHARFNWMMKWNVLWPGIKRIDRMFIDWALNRL